MLGPEAAALLVVVGKEGNGRGFGGRIPGLAKGTEASATAGARMPGYWHAVQWAQVSRSGVETDAQLSGSLNRTAALLKGVMRAGPSPGRLKQLRGMSLAIGQ